MKRREVLAGGLAAASVPGGASIASRAQERRFRLTNKDWAVSIEPATLGLVVQAGGRSVVVSRGADPRSVSALTQTEDRLRWTWGDQFTVICSLAGPDLTIEVTSSSPATLTLVDQPAAALGKGMMLAFGEGYHVAPDDAAWRDFLVNRRPELDAAEDLTLPLWGTDQGGFTLHWIATNPFNTLLRFHAEDGGLGARLEHRFTALAPDAPMTLMLHLAGDDLLAGAKRYRRHSVESGAWRSLAAKIERTPSAAGLVGATHVYLWSNGLIGDKDVTDWPAWLAALKGESALATALRGALDGEARDTIAALPAAAPLPWQRLAVLRAFNAALLALARKRWQLATVDPDALVAAYAELRADVVRVFGKALTPDVASWGDGLSRATFARLREAGLNRLWIGLGDGWEGGLWHPEAVRSAGESGYLIAPYDSYETAIAPGKRPDWATAQLGQAAYDDCAIVQEDGSLRAGFGKEGHYTSTACMMPILKGRVPAIAKAAGFNSWFVDVYASGLLFDDYRPGRRSTKAENAVANIAACRWISEDLQLPTGSEDGRATVADGVVFAHGIETPVMGWGDPDLQKNASSPFFLGAWYPPEAPTLFFKQAPLKEPYRTIYLSPKTRLPLYQAAFHGSAIASHHWMFDQLKIANAMADRAIAQQLYNVPALFHLSAATLAERLPALLRHDAFFRPVHAQLAEETLERFDWLSDDRLVQQTRFSDGTRLIANFDTAARRAGEIEVPPQSVVAIGVGDAPLRFSA